MAKLTEVRVLLFLVIVLLALCSAAQSAVSQERGRPTEEGEWEGKGKRKEKEKEEELQFLLQDGKRVVSTDAGEMRVVKGYGGREVLTEKPLHFGFITMEPKSLFIPQYLDSTLILFLTRGEAKIGMIYKDDLAERWLREGDIYRIPAGSAFYIVNTGEGQRLHIICSIDASHGLGFDAFQSFFVAGGRNPASVLAGFDPHTLSIAFNVTVEELGEIMTQQDAGPIVYTDHRGPRLWSSFHTLSQEQRLQRLKRMAPIVREEEEEEEEEEQEEGKWSYWGILRSLVLGGNKKRRERHGERRGRGAGPDPYNLYNRSPDFKNRYGWSIAIDHHDYHQLKKSHVGLFYVNLSAGTMMAPHLNPTATEYGIVLRGSGTIQIVYPNGTSALKARVKEGDVFWVPRYFPFCQIASRSGPFEFFGFTSSSCRNRPQFLVGASSVLKAMIGPEFATSFGVTEARLREILDAQRESIILPSPAAADEAPVVRNHLAKRKLKDEKR